MAISPDEKSVLSASADKSLRLWSLESGRCRCSLEGHAGRVNAVAFSPDGGQSLSAGEDMTLRLWDMVTGRCVRAFEGHSDRVNCAAFSPDGRRALSGSEDCDLRLWDVASGRCIRTMSGHQGGIKSALWTPEGRCAVSAGDDNALCLWELPWGRLLRTFSGHEYSVYCAALSPDLRYLLSGSGDQTLRVWELSTGRCLRVREEDGAVAFVEISPEGRFAFSGIRGSTSFKLRDIEEKRPEAGFDAHSKPVTCCAVSQSGRYAASGGEDASVQVWRLDWDYEFPDPDAPDERLRPYLEIFLEARQGRWNEEDFQTLLSGLERRGLGWKDPEFVRRELEALRQSYAARREAWARRRYGITILPGARRGPGGGTA